MKFTKNKDITKNKLDKLAFTLVELLVVITILAIISVVAYQNFWWAVDKAVSGRKISDVSTIETSLQQYKADKNYYPPADSYSPTNLWWHTWGLAKPSNTIKVVYNNQEIQSIVSADWGWKVMAKAWTVQIWSKWTISRKTVWKRYLSKDLYDPELWDIKITGTNKKMVDYWIWRYIYAIYKKWTNNLRWNDYNIAYTIKKQESDKYLTKIVWSYDTESCYWDPTDCPDTLIWQYGSGTFLIDKQEQTSYTTTDSNQWIPYAVTDFSN